MLWDDATAEEAARFGQLAALQWIVQHGPAMGAKAVAKTFAAAAAGGHLVGPLYKLESS